jgi:hypothetical protein
MWEQDELGDCGQWTITYLWDAFKSRLEFVVLISTRGGLRPDMLIPTIVVVIISIHGLPKYWIETGDHDSSDVAIIILHNMHV